MNPAITDNVMVDIESVGRRPTGLIISLGAVRFSTKPEDVRAGRIFSENPEDEFHAVLNYDAMLNETRLVTEPATLKWWTEQGDAWSRIEALMRASEHDLKSLMTAFVEWLQPFCAAGCNVIGNSPSFDLVMIESACKVTDVKFPVEYRSESDYRMLTDIVYGPANKPRPSARDAHDALFDAKFQAKVYAEALLDIQDWRRVANRRCHYRNRRSRIATTA